MATVSSWDHVRASWARTPSELASATCSRSVVKDPYAWTPDASAAAMTSRAAAARNSGVASAVASGRRAVHVGDGGRTGQVDRLLCLRHEPRDAGRRLGQMPEGLVVGAVGGGAPHAPAVHEAQVDHRVGLGHVLVDLAVGEARQPRLGLDDEDLCLRRAKRIGVTQHPLGQLQAAGVPRFAHHLPTPTWTSRNRAPLAPWPTCPFWPGSPLPQFGVPNSDAGCARRRRRRTSPRTRR